jgi:hypothetical protein
MSNLSNITLNGQPLEIALRSVNRLNSSRQDTEKPIEFIVAHSRPIVSRSFRNTSGARSGKGRVIYSASWGRA